MFAVMETQGVTTNYTQIVSPIRQLHHFKYSVYGKNVSHDSIVIDYYCIITSTFDIYCIPANTNTVSLTKKVYLCIMIAHRTRQLLLAYAAEYETADFLNGDPSWFMHQVNGQQNQESMALLASILSFGSRTQFMPKIQWLLDRSQGDVDYWIRSGSFARDLPASSPQCFYRLFTVERMNQFLEAYRHLLLQHGSMGQYIERNAHTGIDALAAICSFFSQNGISVVVPKDTHSACKRLCMFLRWMVRDQSPVDLGLWSHIIDKRTLIMPLDTHVLSQALRLGLMSSRSATLSSAIQLTKTVAEIFPDDPLLADFALFGYGIHHSQA